MVGNIIRSGGMPVMRYELSLWKAKESAFCDFGITMFSRIRTLCWKQFGMQCTKQALPLTLSQRERG
jgi:hypothetical protein